MLTRKQREDPEPAEEALQHSWLFRVFTKVRRRGTEPEEKSKECHRRVVIVLARPGLRMS